MNFSAVFNSSSNSLKGLGKSWIVYLILLVIFNGLKILIPEQQNAVIANALIEIVSGVVGFFFIFECFEILKGSEKGLTRHWTEAFYRLPRVLLIAIAYSLLFLGGLIALVVPAFLVVAFFGLAPFVPLFEPGTVKPFKRSKELFLKSPMVSVTLLILSTLFEFVPFLSQGASISPILKFSLMFLTDLVGLGLYGIIAALYFVLLNGSKE